MAIFTGVLWIIGTLTIPETYAPVLLRARAKKLSQKTGMVYKTQTDIDQGEVSLARVLKTALSRPWILLFREPIVLLLSIYMSVIYGTLYMLFGAFPIVYQQERGWSAGIGGLAFLGVMVGMIGAVLYTIVYDNKRYAAISDKNSGFAPPEARLPACMLGGILIPVGLFWFAWTNSPSIHWIVSASSLLTHVSLTWDIGINLGGRTIRLWHGARIPEFDELPHRCIYDICCGKHIGRVHRFPY